MKLNIWWLLGGLGALWLISQNKAAQPEQPPAPAPETPNPQAVQQ